MRLVVKKKPRKVKIRFTCYILIKLDFELTLKW